ncbi:hypothetical protein [Ruminococcus sp.]|uniref:hypothetical protein n=1 Tax=Ruminococcus sp. TaxID=41978 RepID=UPI0025F9DE6E|nr:hypothetical protein [Ruminococcus sp.]
MRKENKIIEISNEKISSDFFSRSAFLLTKSSTPLLAILADRKDGCLDIFLLKKSNQDFQLLGRRKIPFCTEKVIAEGLTSMFIQQVKSEKNKLNIVAKKLYDLFLPSKEKKGIFESLLVQIKIDKFTFVSVYQDIYKLMKNCRFDFSKFRLYIRNKDPFYMSFCSNMLLHWNLLMQMSASLLGEAFSGREYNSSVSYFLFGEIMTLLSFIVPTRSGQNLVQFRRTNREMPYLIAANFLKHLDNFKNCDLEMSISAFPFEEKIVSASQKMEEYQKKYTPVQKKQVSIFLDHVYSIPTDSSIFAGSTNGKQLNLNGNLIYLAEDKMRLFVAPFSEDFSFLIASGQVTIKLMKWEIENEEWKFIFEYEHEGRTRRLKPQIYSGEKIIELEHFPSIVVYKKPNDKSLYAYSESDCVQVSVFSGLQKDNLIAIPEKSPTIYFGIYNSNNEFMMQVDFSFLQKR